MKTKNLIYTSLLLAIGIILPFITHSLSIPGTVFLPMHIPVFISGILLGPLAGALLGFALPIISHFLIQMPIVPILYIMIFELLAYGLFIGIIFNKSKNIGISLVFSMIIGRIIGAITAFVLFQLLGLSSIPVTTWIYGSIIIGLPGIIIQLIIIPILAKVVIKNNIL